MSKWVWWRKLYVICLLCCYSSTFILFITVQVLDCYIYICIWLKQIKKVPGLVYSRIPKWKINLWKDISHIKPLFFFQHRRTPVSSFSVQLFLLCFYNWYIFFSSCKLLIDDILCTSGSLICSIWIAFWNGIIYYIEYM